MNAEPPQWLLAEYAPVSLFSLRPSLTTAAGGQTLLVPTPYAIKLALTDAVIRAEGVDAGRNLFATVQPMEVRLRPPAYTVVTHTFNRVRWWGRGDKSEADGDNSSDAATDASVVSGSGGPWATRIAYREYCFHLGTIQLALRVAGQRAETLDRLRSACSLVTYFGKRGSFFQFLDTWELVDLPDGFDEAAVPPPPNLNYAQVQLLDDMPNEPRTDLWARVNTFSPARVRLEEDRLVRDRLRVLPMRRVSSGRSFTLYERTL